MIDITMLSHCYDVRRLTEAKADVDGVADLCWGNPQFYLYSAAKPTREQVLDDMRITPPGTERRDKYYIGFYQKGVLAAVMDLIDGYPAPDTAYIGFFMMKKEFQGQGRGSALIREVTAYLKETGKRSVRLAIDKGNPQSTRFWKKNGFVIIDERERNGQGVLVAEKAL